MVSRHISLKRTATLKASAFKMQAFRPEFFYKLIYGNCFSDLGSGGRKKINKKALKMTS